MNKITFRPEGNKGIYSCGCVDEVIGENYFIKPCSLDCEVYLYALEQSRKQGNIINFKRFKGEKK
jgi:hypothetical protein